MALKGNMQKVYDAMPIRKGPGASDDNDSWTDAAAIAEATGVKPSTVGDNLRKLEGDGLAESYDQGRGKVKLWRAIDKAAEAGLVNAGADAAAPEMGADEVARLSDAQTQHDAGRAVGDAETMPRSVGAVVYQAPGEAPTAPLAAPAGDGVGDVAAFMASNRPIPTASEPEAKAPQTGVCTVPGCGIALVKDGRSWKAADPADAARDSGHKHTTAAQREPRERGERPADAPQIWAKGTLAPAILSYLQKNPDEALGATAVAKAVGAQTGSTQFALDKYVTTGHVKVSLNDKGKKRYQAA